MEVCFADPGTDLPHGAEFGKKVVSLSRKKLKKLKIFPDPETRFGSGAIENDMAEGVRFELTRPFGLPVFKTGAINRSATPPGYPAARIVPSLRS